MKQLVCGLCSLLLFSTVALAQPKTGYNLEDARDNMDAYMKVRASLQPGDEVVFYAKGSIYAYDPEKPWKHLFNFEMYNIARGE